MGNAKRDEAAVQLASRPVRRGLQDDPLRQISFRHDSSKVTLSPHLVADLVLNDWSFEYRGRTFIDHESRQRGQGYWQSRIAKNLPGFVKYGGAKYIGKSIKSVSAPGFFLVCRTEVKGTASCCWPGVSALGRRIRDENGGHRKYIVKIARYQLRSVVAAGLESSA